MTRVSRLLRRFSLDELPQFINAVRGDPSFEERLAMERDHLDNISVAGDLAILLRTPAAIIRGEGSH